jgi:glycosyltransferase involved in cell wall biosynthesis
MNNNNLKKVSIVMSVYGYGEFIYDSIKSILDQTLKDFEFIIIDDGCDYDLPAIIKKFNDGRIRYIKNSKNSGLTSSLIKGINESEGKYIARHDAGNISLKNRLETQYKYLEENNHYYLVGSSVELIDGEGSTICKIIVDDDPSSVKKKLPVYNCINHSSIMFKNGGGAGYREKFKYSQDYDFYLNLLSENFTLGNIKEVLVKERMLPSSITYFKREEQEYFRRMAQKFYFERIKYGRDSYDSMDMEYSPSDTMKGKIQAKEKEECAETKFYKRQKIYYLLFSLRTKKARKDIIKYLKDEFDLKLFIYFIVSFFPFAIKLVNKIKGVEYR